jgi:hypothetical protein
MILGFELQGEVVSLKVSRSRQLLLSGKNTNGRYVDLSLLADGSGLNDKEGAALVRHIVKALPTIELVKKYLVYEMRTKGFTYLGEKHGV